MDCGFEGLPVFVSTILGQSFCLAGSGLPRNFGNDLFSSQWVREPWSILFALLGILAGPQYLRRCLHTNLEYPSL